MLFSVSDPFLGMRVTTVLILLCFLASLYAWTANPVTVQNDLVFSLSNLLAGRVWTVVTAIFVHANLLHLVGNMIFLYVFGSTLEGVADSKRMLLAFFLGGIVSFLLSLPFFPSDATFVGASAAIFTLTAVVMLMKPLRFSFLLLMPVGLVAVLYFLYNAAAVYYHLQSDVAYVSHNRFLDRITSRNRLEPTMEEEPTNLDWTACRILRPALLDHNVRATLIPLAFHRS